MPRKRADPAQKYTRKGAGGTCVCRAKSGAPDSSILNVAANWVAQTAWGIPEIAVLISDGRPTTRNMGRFGITTYPIP